MGRIIDVRSWVSGDRSAAANSLRFISSTTARCLAQGKDEERGSPPPAAQKDASGSSKPQPQPKGLRKVLPSLTPHENIYTVPNLLTFSRLVAAPFIGYAILHDAHTLALGLFAYAGVSDLLDGWIARRWKLQTVVGSVVDPMADKLLMTVLTVCLAMQGSLPGEFCLSSCCLLSLPSFLSPLLASFYVSPYDSPLLTNMATSVVRNFQSG